MIGRNDAYLIDVAGIVDDLDATYFTVLHSGVLEEAAPLAPKIKNRI